MPRPAASAARPHNRTSTDSARRARATRRLCVPILAGVLCALVWCAVPLGVPAESVSSAVKQPTAVEVLASPDVACGLPREAIERIGADLRRTTSADQFESVVEKVLECTADPGTAASLRMELGLALGNAGRTAPATDHLKQALALFRESAAADSVAIGTCHTTLGGALVRLNLSSEAEHHLTEGIAILSRHLEPDNLLLVRARTSYATHLHARGLTNEAIQLLVDLFHLLEGKEDARDADLGWVAHNIATYHHVQADLQEALDWYQRAIAYRLSPGLATYLADSKRGLAGVWRDLGNYQRAIAELNEVEELRTPESDWRRAVYMLNDRASLYVWTADPGTAIHYFEQAIALQNEHAGEFQPLALRIASGLGSAYSAVGRYDEACRYLRQVTHARRAPSSLHPNVKGWAHFHLGRTLTAMGNKAEAIVEFQAAIDHFSRPPTQQLGRGLALIELGFTEGNTASTAEAAIRGGLNLLLARLPDTHPDIARLRARYAEFLLARGKTNEAWVEAIHAARAGAEAVRIASKSMTQRHALQFSQDLNRSISVLLSVLERNPDDAQMAQQAWQVIANTRGLVRREMLRRSDVQTRHHDPHLQALLEERQAAKRALANLFLRGPVQEDEFEYRQALERATARVETAERKLALEMPTADVHDQHLSFDALIDAAVDSIAVVAFAHTPSNDHIAGHYTAFVNDGDLRAVPLGPAETVESAIDSYRQHFERAAETFRLDPAATTEQLRGVQALVSTTIWKPLKLLPSSNKLLLVVPAGAIHHVALAALPGSDSEFVFEEWRGLHRLDSERDIVAERHRPVEVRHTAPRTAVVVGDVDYSGHGTDIDGRPRHTQLAIGESDMVAESLQHAGLEVYKLSGRAATESALCKALPGATFAHVSTHGFHQAPDRSRPFDTILGSGLVLAADPGPVADEDGYLTAEELSGLNLGQLDMAILSACSSGAGFPWTLEGILGIQGAFLEAGANGLLISLWPISVNASGEFVAAFYRSRFVEGLSVASAIQASRREIVAALRRKEHTHPVQWAGFVAIGSWL